MENNVLFCSLTCGVHFTRTWRYLHICFLESQSCPTPVTADLSAKIPLITVHYFTFGQVTLDWGYFYQLFFISYFLSDVGKLMLLDNALPLALWFYIRWKLLMDVSSSVISMHDVISVCVKVWTVHLFHFTYVCSLWEVRSHGNKQWRKAWRR